MVWGKAGSSHFVLLLRCVRAGDLELKVVESRFWSLVLCEKFEFFFLAAPLPPPPPPPPSSINFFEF